MEWYNLAPKSDRHAPKQEERAEEVNEDGVDGWGDASLFGKMPDMEQ